MIAQPKLTLISHKLCPYVQRAVIALDRKSRAVRAPRHRSCQQARLVLARLAARQDAGAAGACPAKVGTGFAKRDMRKQQRDGHLRVRRDPRISRGDAAEPAAPCRSPRPRRASRLDRVRLGDPQRHLRALHGAADEAAFNAKTAALQDKFARVEARLQGPWFDGERFSLVDAVFGPVFRYFDAFDRIGDVRHPRRTVPSSPHGAAHSRRAPLVQAAVAPEYPALLWEFYRTRGSHLSRLIGKAQLAA